MNIKKPVLDEPFFSVSFYRVPIIYFLQVHRIYRSTGASFDKAKQEFSTGVMRNETVQGVASNAAQGAVKGMASQYGSNNKYWSITYALAQGHIGIIGDYMLEVCPEDVKHSLCMNFVVLKYFLSYGVIVYLYFHLLLNGKDL